MGRPSEFTQEKADIICERIAEGRSLVDVCKDDDMPTATTVYKWLNQQPDFVEMYARARETQADVHADQIIAIADDFNDDPNSRRVRIDSRKWIAAKLKPRKYGDKIDHEHSGTVGIEFVTVYEKTITTDDTREVYPGYKKLDIGKDE